MGIISRIKAALFEEEEVVEESVAKKIEVAPKEEIKIRHYEDEPAVTYVEEAPQSPVIFDVEDFIEEEVQPPKVEEQPKIEEKIIYGGYESKEEKIIQSKEKFKPSPIISPVYGILDKNYVIEEDKKDKKTLDQLFADEKRKVDFDVVRNKAFGGTNENVKPEEEETNLLYEMQDIDDKPGIEKISIGDAEEYFEDLGLEYNVDYTDLAKEKLTRSKKNEVLVETINEEIKEDTLIEQELAKDNKIEDESFEDPEEKNLYDLIDMMYEKKE